MGQELRVASPCSADWEKMIGDDRVRFCSQCNLHVYNFGTMTEREIKQLVREKVRDCVGVCTVARTEQ